MNGTKRETSSKKTNRRAETRSTNFGGPESRCTRFGGTASTEIGFPGRGRNHVLILVVLLFAVGAGQAAAQEFGRVVYLEGSVTMYQEGEEQFVDIGTAVFPGDLLRTGTNGYLELEVNTGPTTVKVAEETALYVERRSSSDGRSETGFQLLRGNLDFVVNRLAGNEAVSVDTYSVSMGVRGTEFAVRTSPDDSVAVGVSEGSVSVTGERTSVRADSGEVVESIQRGDLESREVESGNINEYLEGWRQTRLEAFRSGAETFVTAYARRYLDQRPRFVSAYRTLAAYAEELSSAAEDSGMRGRGDRFQLRAEVSGPAVQVRSILPLFENTFYRLAELEGFHAEGVGRTRINDELNSREFFRRYNSERGRIEVQLAEARHLLRLYRELEKGTMGGLPSGESPFDSDSMKPDF